MIDLQRTKRWMHNPEFSNNLLFFPQMAAAETLPAGVPGGLKGSMLDRVSSKVFWMLNNFEFFFGRISLDVFIGSCCSFSGYTQPLQPWAKRRPLLHPSKTTSWNTHLCCVTLCMACSVQPFTWRTGSMDCCLEEIFWMFQRSLAALTMKRCNGNLVFPKICSSDIHCVERKRHWSWIKFLFQQIKFQNLISHSVWFVTSSLPGTCSFLKGLTSQTYWGVLAMHVVLLLDVKHLLQKLLK